MSLATDLTACQGRIVEAERMASAGLRRWRDVIPPAVYSELQLQLCVIASESTKFKVCLGSLRMIGELDQMPPEVTAETLELSREVPRVEMWPEHVRLNDRNVLVESGEGVERA